VLWVRKSPARVFGTHSTPGPSVLRTEGPGVPEFSEPTAHLDPQYAKLNLPVRVTFQNAEMTSYVVTESIIPGELRITKLSTSEAL